MTVFIYITVALLLYPIIGWITYRQTVAFAKTQKTIVLTLSIVCSLVFLSLITNVITISQNLNWILLTSTYLTIFILLCIAQRSSILLIQITGFLLRLIIYGIGYLVAILGFFIVLIISLELEPTQKKWLTNDLIYFERNIGSGPDPSVRLKKIEVYKKMFLFPILAYRIKEKTYDEWNLPLNQKLDIAFSAKDKKLYLSSINKGDKDFDFKDTISLTEKHYR